MIPSRFIAPMLIGAAALAVSGCATQPFTGPVEVTRFVAKEPAALGLGPIVIHFPDAMPNEAVKTAFTAAIGNELRSVGYTIVSQEGPGIQVATVRTSRNPIAAIENNRGPVSVGVGGQTGSFGSGVGMGIGINLGGGREGPAAMTDLSVRITAADTTTLWEGRAQLATGVKSPYSQPEASARALAGGLFKDFPGGNGETVSIKVKDLKLSETAPR
jgi:hypothetical protein